MFSVCEFSIETMWLWEITQLVCIAWSLSFHALSFANFAICLCFCALSGYEKYNTIRADPTLCFIERVGRPDEKAIAAEQRGNDFMDGWVHHTSQEPENYTAFVLMWLKFKYLFWNGVSDVNCKND